MGEGVLERHCLFPDELDSGLQLEPAGGRVSESPGSCSSFPATRAWVGRWAPRTRGGNSQVRGPAARRLHVELQGVQLANSFSSENEGQARKHSSYVLTGDGCSHAC